MAITFVLLTPLSILDGECSMCVDALKVLMSFPEFITYEMLEFKYDY